MRNEDQVRERRQRLQTNLLAVREAWGEAIDRPTPDRDAQFLSAQITVLEASIGELDWVLEEGEAEDAGQ
jgi:hypothetical protein